MVLLQTIGGALWIVGIIIAIIVAFWILGIRFVPNNKVGIVEKVISKKENTGTVIALNGEAGFQAELLRGGLHIRPRPFYKIHKVNLITIPQGEIGYVFARDGKALQASQTLGATVECDNFEDVKAFLGNGGQKGPQRSILREGAYALNLAQFIVITKDRTYYMPLGLPGEKEQIHKMSSLIQERSGFYAQIISERDDQIGIVTVHDGPSIDNGELIAPSIPDHNMYQDPQQFINNGGRRGRQLDVLTDGTYFINVLFATIERIPKTEIPIGQVGVVNYFTGEDGEDVSGDDYQHGDLVERGKKGVWQEVLRANKYPWNTYAGKIYLVPVTNFILKWASEEGSEFGYDDKLQEITLITEDAFQPALPLSVVIHINYHDAPKVIQRFGDIKTLVEETIDPLVGAYFKNIAQQKTLLQLIQERNDIQEKAAKEMKQKFAEYDLNLVEVLIGTPRPSSEDSRIGEIYTQLQDRQLAKEESITLEAKTENEKKKRTYAQAQQEAAMQEEITASEKKIIVVENEGKAEVKKAEQAAAVMEKNARAEALKTEIDAEAAGKKVEILAKSDAERDKIAADAAAYTITSKAKAESQGTLMEGEAKADAIARMGIAQGITTSEQVSAMGANNMVQMEIAKAFATALAGIQGNLVPNSVVNFGGEGNNSTSGILELLLLKFLDPKLIGEITDQVAKTGTSEETKAMAEKIKKEVMDKATSEGTGIDSVEEKEVASETSGIDAGEKVVPEGENDVTQNSDIQLQGEDTDDATEENASGNKGLNAWIGDEEE